MTLKENTFIKYNGEKCKHTMSFFLTLSERNVIILQSLKNPLVHLSLLGKTWSGQVDYPSLSNCSTSPNGRRTS